MTRITKNNRHKDENGITYNYNTSTITYINMYKHLEVFTYLILKVIIKKSQEFSA